MLLKKISLYDGKNLVMTMPAPFLVDNAGERNYDVQTTLDSLDGVYVLSYVLPQEWLADDNREWPVVLDPIVYATASTGNIRDITLYSKTYLGYQNGILQCGNHPSWGVGHIYLKYAQLPVLGPADVIVAANVTLFTATTPIAAPRTVEVHKVTGTWESETITWNNKPDFVDTIEDYQVCQTMETYYTWDITDIVRGWYDGENTGMLFKMDDASEASTTDTKVQFYSSDYGVLYKPTVLIMFRNNNGLEGYWDYTGTSAGRAGTGYVNQYTGNLVWTHGDIGFGGNRMPISISHVYNAGDSTQNTFGMGYGWRTNFNQRVYHWNEANSYGDYYVWEDADGTKHYFYYDAEGKCYKDEDGMELTLSVSSSGYTITDKYGNKSIFGTNGRLTQQQNNQSTPSSISIAYNSSGLISTVTDGAGRIYVFSYTNGLLTSISYKGTRGANGTTISSVSFAYDNSKNLTSITYPDGKSSSYSYTNHLLTSAADIDGYKIQYGYNTTAAGMPNRIASISEFVGTNAGGYISIDYGHNQTTFTDHNGNSQTVQFNNWGNTISVQDNQGRAQFAQFALNDPANPDDPNTASEAGYQNAKGNQLRLSSKLQNTVGNILNNSSFEQSGNWTATSSTVTVSVDSGTAYYGSNALKLVRSSAGTAAGAYSASFSVEAETTYTFSAYVKTGAGTAYLALNDGSTTVTSETLAANSDWTRLEVSYTNNGSTAKTVTAGLLTAQAGTVYMDCVQVEKAPTASRYNLVENGDFRYTGSWNLSTGRVTLTENTAPAPQLSGNVYKMTGNPTSTNRISQTVNVSGEAGESFVLAGWAKADSAPLDSYDTNPREFALLATIYYTDGTTETVTVRFNPCVNTWQYAAGGFEAEKAFTHIVIELAYDYNVNDAYFDGIQLYNESFGTAYSYNENGDVTEAEDIQGGTTTYTYENNNLTRVTLPDGSETTYTYDIYHNVETATTNTGVVYELTYDAWGNNTSVAITSGTLTLRSVATYNYNGTLLRSTTDTAGNVTRYGYNVDTNLLEWVQYPRDTESTQTEYTYDTMYRLYTASVTTNQSTAMQVSYGYTNDLLTSVTTKSTTYTLTYNDFSQIDKIKAGSYILASYTYTADQNKYLQRLAYGNGDSVEYKYDGYGRLIKQTWEDGDTVSYAYDNSGALATVTDSATGRTTTYYYDFTDRLTKYVESGADFYHSVSYVYSDADENGELKTLVETINDAQITTGYNYDTDNRVTGVVHTINLDEDAEAEATVGRGYQYDAYGRLSRRIAGNGTASPVVTDEFTYRSPTTGATSGQVAQFKTTSAGGYSKTYTYTYDANGNITSIFDGTYTTTYAYDSQNQLLREDNENANKTWVWTYDDAGNILSKTQYTYTTGDVTGLTPTDTSLYTYGNSQWGDLLTGYDGKTLTYDTVGNLLSDGTWTYTWEHGRQLKSMTNGTKTWTFTYNADGMRTSRTDGSTKYEYVYNGSQLSQMTVTTTSATHVFHFTYDASGTPLSFTLNGTLYYYATNLQGDVVAVLNASGGIAVDYNYTAWGTHIGSTITSDPNWGTIFLFNPLQYRGYVFDWETGLCYLQSRYYNPEIGRFINADAYVSTGQGFTGNNMFVYCLNNPINRADAEGCISYDCKDEDANNDDDPLNDVARMGNSGNTGQSQKPATGSSNSSTTTVIGSGHGSTQHKGFIDNLISCF